MRLGTTELLLILAIALLLFGGKKLTGLGKALGSSIREFKSEIKAPEPAKEKGVEKVEEQDGAAGK